MKFAQSLAVLSALFVCLPALAGEKMHSSIQVSFTKVKSDSAEEANTPRLFKLAKLSKEQAKAIAAQKFKGKFGAVDLENEDGNLIWSVEIGRHELAIDAGNGKILTVE